MHSLSSDSSTSDLESIVTCAVCIERFESPRVLPCQHTFCTKCLRQLWQQGQIQCPECRQDFEVRNLSSLKPNPIVNNLLDALKVHDAQDTSIGQRELKEPVLCDLCSGKTEAYSRCISCGRYYCKLHDEAHSLDKQKMGHKVLKMDDLLKKENFAFFLRAKPSFCQEHGDPPLELRYYCRDCETVTCNDCNLVRHKNHDVTLLKEVAAEKRKLLKTNIAVLSNVRLSEIMQSSETVESLKTRLDAIPDTILKEIDAYLQEVREQLLQQVSDVTRAERKRTDARADELQTLRARLESVVLAGQTNMMHCSDHEFILAFDGLFQSTRDVMIESTAVGAHLDTEFALKLKRIVPASSECEEARRVSTGLCPGVPGIEGSGIAKAANCELLINGFGKLEPLPSPASLAKIAGAALKKRGRSEAMLAFTTKIPFCTVGETLTVTLKARDSQKRECTRSGPAAVVSAEYRGALEEWSGKPGSVEIDDQGNGIFRIRVIPETAGVAYVIAHVNGEPVPGSPVPVQAYYKVDNRAIPPKPAKQVSARSKSGCSST